MLIGRRYLLVLNAEQAAYAETVGDTCRAVWNSALEQRREYRQRGAWINYAEQARQLADAKKELPWLAEAPSHTLQQTLMDLDRACRRHGTFRVHWRSKTRTSPSFRFPAPEQIEVKRLNRKIGAVRLPKFGWVRFRWSRPLDGAIRHATVMREGGRWYISFCVEDGIAIATPNGKPPVGVDRGVKVAVATSDGLLRNRDFVTLGEAERMRRLQQQLARQTNTRSKRRMTTRRKLAVLHARIRHRRSDFAAWTADRLTRDHGLVVVEDLKVKNMTAAARGKTGLNRAILDKGWGQFMAAVEHKARYNGSRLVKVNPAFTSQTCSACGHVARESRESQAAFRCVACGFVLNADVNAARNILARGIDLVSAAGLAVAGRGDLDVGRSVKRQPPVECAA